MEQLTCVIIEDDLLSLKSLEHIVSKTDALNLKGSFANGTDALAFLKENTVDLLYLDVELPDMKGWELLEQLSYFPIIVVTTTNKEYAFDALQYKVADFLEKPISSIHLNNSLKNVYEQFNHRKILQSNNDIYIKVNGKLVRVDYNKILYIENLADYVKIITTENVYIIYCTMKHLEARLPSTSFMKIHRSYIINLNKIQYIEDSDVFLHNRLIPIARSQKNDLIEKLNLL